MNNDAREVDLFLAREALPARGCLDGRPPRAEWGDDRPNRNGTFWGWWRLLYLLLLRVE
jgi:hypothetical protein